MFKKIQYQIIDILLCAKSSLAKIRWFWFAFTLVVFLSLIKLAYWQQSRAEEKQQRLTRIEQLAQQTGLTLTQLQAVEQKLPAQETINDYPVQLSGEFLGEYMFFLDNQVNKGRLGYRVFQVFASAEQWLLVNLGWVAGSINRQELPATLPLTGSYQFKGHVRFIESGIVLQEEFFSQVDWPLRVQQISLEKFSTLLNLPLLPFVVYVDKQAELGYEKNWQPIVMPPEKHSAYAFQWFSLSIAWLILMMAVSGMFTCSHKKTYKENK